MRDRVRAAARRAAGPGKDVEAMEWEQLVRETARESGCSEGYAEELLESFFGAVADGMQTDRLVMLRPDLGYFEMRPAASGRRRQVPVFKKSGQLKALLRGTPEKGSIC